MKYLLIHGYGVGLQYSFLKQAEGINAGFGAFNEFISSGEARVFRWDIPRRLNLMESINPLVNLGHYHKELDKARNKETHQALQQVLDETEPETIICHSAGSFLLYSYLQEYTLPSSVTNIVFIQSNIPRDCPIPEYLVSKLNQKQITMLNLYCYWDQALWSLFLVHQYIALGLWGSKNPLIHNIFFPLYKRFNLHTSSINDKGILRVIEENS